MEVCKIAELAVTLVSLCGGKLSASLKLSLLNGSLPQRPHFSTSIVSVSASFLGPLPRDKTLLAVVAVNLQCPLATDQPGERQNVP